MNDWQPLSLIEQNDLKRYEATIQRGLDTFVAVGNALLAIKNDRLWRMTHSSFDAYVMQRWHMTQNYANRLIGSAAVIGNLEQNVPMGTILPVTERQARPLASLPSDQQREVWAEVVESAPNGKVTAAHVQAVVAEYQSEVKPRLNVHYSSDTPEHYTPKEIIDAVIFCMGAIDLDPCSNSHSQPNVPATMHYTIEDDGLAQPWFGRVFLNPPYGREIGKWIDKLCGDYVGGNVTEAIALVPARTDTDWFEQLMECEGHPLLCLVHGRLQFVGNEGNAPFPSAIVYLGTEWGHFYAAFGDLGRIVQEVYPGVTFGE